MNVGDAVLVHTFGGFPMGGRVIQAPTGGYLWIDLCMLGQHLPQMYRVDELGPLDATVAETNGLCGGCLGYGATGDVEIAAGIDQVENSCPACGGTGRTALRVVLLRGPNQVEAMLDVLPHVPRPSGGIACVACGMGADHEAHQ